MTQRTINKILTAIRIVWITIRGSRNFFNGLFMYYCDRQPRIKHENPRWRYALYITSALQLLLLLLLLLLLRNCSWYKRLRSRLRTHPQQCSVYIRQAATVYRHSASRPSPQASGRIFRSSGQRQTAGPTGTDCSPCTEVLRGGRRP